MKLYGMDIEISDALKAKIEIYNSFVQEAEKYREEYTEFFYNCSSTESIVRSSRSEAFGYYNAMAQKILNILAANNIYTYTIVLSQSTRLYKQQDQEANF